MRQKEMIRHPTDDRLLSPADRLQRISGGSILAVLYLHKTKVGPVPRHDIDLTLAVAIIHNKDLIALTP